MVIKTTLLTALVTLSLATAPLQAGEYGRGASAGTQLVVTPVDALALRPSQDAGDVLGGRGPNPHARELRNIAIYESIGNRDGVAMLSDQLHQFGVTRQTIQRVVDHTRLHDGTPIGLPAFGPEVRADAGLDRTQ